MPFHPSPYGSPANPVIPIDYQQYDNPALSGHSPGPGRPSQQYNADSPQSHGIVPNSGQSDHNSVRRYDLASLAEIDILSSI